MSELPQSSMANTTHGRRTPQACIACRRRKTKCDGRRPSCRYCSRRKRLCEWPPSVSGAPDSAPGSPTTPEAEPVAPIPDAIISLQANGLLLPPLPKLQRTFDLFFEHHFAIDFCSFDFKPTFTVAHESRPLLVLAIIVLCAQYLTPEEASRDYGLAAGHEVRARYAPAARSVAKESFDSPTVSNIQGYLVLALSEWIANTGSRHWLYAGNAIRMAQIMRLNKEYQQKHSLQEQETRRRTFWACFMMDRLLAYSLSKPRTVSVRNIGVALPSTDVSVVYREPTKGITLANLMTHTLSPSHIGLSPYFLKTICLWSDMADMTVCHRRFIDNLSPLDPKSLFARRSQAVHDWANMMPVGLHWTTDNYAAQSQLGQGQVFVAMHLLLRGAFCVAHQSYLPQLDGSSMLLDHLDAAGWSLLQREPSLISTCVQNALEIGEILQATSNGALSSMPKYTWLLCSFLPVANVFLWLQYAKDDEFATENIRDLAKTYFDNIHAILLEWSEIWNIAEEWLVGLRTMEVTYRAAYLGEVPPHAELEQLSPSTQRDDVGNDYRPRPGDGCPLVSGASNLYDSLRMITTESAAVEDMQSVWLFLAGGWSTELGDLLIPGLTTDFA